MSRFLLLCRIDPSKLDLFAAYRAQHYAFLIEEQARIVFGGPTRVREQGPPETMLIVIEATSLAEAEAFSAREPYTAHGGFASVEIRPWTQVLPELEPGTLARTLEAERSQRGA